MSELQHWFIARMGANMMLQAIYNEHSVYTSLFCAQATGLWRIH